MVLCLWYEKTERDGHFDDEENNIDGIEVKFPSKHGDFCALFDSCDKFELFKMDLIV